MNSPQYQGQDSHECTQCLAGRAKSPTRPNATDDEQREPKHRINDVKDHICFGTCPSLKAVLVGSQDLVGEEDSCFDALNKHRLVRSYL